MSSLLVVTYETSTGQYYTQKIGGSQISDAVIASGHLTSALIAAIGAGVADGGITSAKIASGAVGDAHIYPASILSSKIAANVIGTYHILNQGILSASIGAAVLGGVHIYSGSIAGDNLANALITSSKIAANIIATPHIANQGILSASIGAAIIGGVHLAEGLITSGKIADYGVASGKIASGVITENELVSGISIDISEMSQEPTYRAQVPISGFLAIQFSVSGYFSFARAGDISSLPSIGITNAYINSGQIGTFLYGGRMANAGWNFSGSMGRLLYTGTSSEVTIMVSGLMVSGQCVQRLAKVAGPSTIFVKPDPMFIQIAE